jgi:hypothetical protein
MRAKLDAEIAASKAFVDAELGKLGVTVPRPPAAAPTPPTSKPTTGKAPSIPTGPGRAGPVGSAGLVHPVEAITLLMPEPAQITQSASFVVSSPFVQNNPLYRARVASVSFEYVAADATANAFATDGAAVQTPDGRTIEPPLVMHVEMRHNARDEGLVRRSF